MTESTAAPTAGIGSVGFIGLGKMGQPMCRRIVVAGWPVVGYDQAPGVVDALAGIAGFSAAASLSDVAAHADVVILMLPNSDVVDAVVNGGLVDGLRPGTVVIDMSSSVPARTRALSTRLAEHGVVLLDAPVSGGVGGAMNGTLTVMVGGPAETFASLSPLLRAMGDRVEHVGEVGAGHAVKALNNLMSAAHLWASSEALLAARRFGLKVTTALKVINTSSGRSGSTENKWPNFVLTGRYDSGFALGLMSKDVKIALDLIKSVGVSARVSQAVSDVWEAANAGLDHGADHTEIVKWLELESDPAQERPQNASLRL